MATDSFGDQSVSRSSVSRLGLLVVAVAAVAGIWLVVLPWLSERPSQREYQEWLEMKRIDPSAMYYTEVEAFEPVLDRLNRQQRK